MFNVARFRYGSNQMEKIIEYPQAVADVTRPRKVLEIVVASAAAVLIVGATWGGLAYADGMAAQ